MSFTSYGIDRNIYGKSASLTRYTIHFNRTFEQLYQHTDDGKSESESFFSLSARQAGELLKDTFTVGRLHSLTSISDGNYQLTGFVTGRHGNTAPVRKLHGIGQQIINNLAQTQGIADISTS